jgi:hypothetical protein
MRLLFPWGNKAAVKSKAMVVNVAEKWEQDFDRHD